MPRKSQNPTFSFASPDLASDAAASRGLELLENYYQYEDAMIFGNGARFWVAIIYQRGRTFAVEMTNESDARHLYNRHK